ncbi:MAG: hypothetical protein KAJ18_11545 [Candidatus Omnitrophica bacterium]|nr:hypothetical protein [Candidatus Omnitrophota bacterium]
MKKKVYHYTTKEAYDEIMRTKQLLPSSPWTTMDSAYGTGWYFTDLGPDQCDMSVAYYCWKNANLIDKVRYYLAFDIDDSILKSCRAHVWMINKWDESLITYVGGDKNRDCSSKPCSTCEKGKKYR